MRRTWLMISFGAALVAVSSPSRADDFAPGSVIVPMDTTYQDMGMFKAYGLVYELLRQGVPVRWSIAPNKLAGAADFVASGQDHLTQASVVDHGYRGGPWIIDSASAPQALPIIDAWQAQYPETAVHIATQAFTAPVAKRLVAAPKVAMFADGNQKIARGYLAAAKIPDSTLDYTWPDASPDMLTVAEVTGTDAANNDGALFDKDGHPRYCQFMSMHWGVNDAVNNPGVVAEVRQYLKFPTHFFAECQAVNAFENHAVHGHFLTPNGFLVASQPNSIQVLTPDSPFAQLDGPFKTVGGSEPAYMLPAGDSYIAGGVTLITEAGAAAGTHDLWMTGYLDGACSSSTTTCMDLGKVSYLGGHEYKTAVPISQNGDSQGTRLFLNSLFDSECATDVGVPVLSVDASAPAFTLIPEITFTLSTTNTMGSVALDAVLSDAVPPGATFVSASDGGVEAGGVVSFNLENLGKGETKSVNYTVSLSAPGSYKNSATLNYKVGITSFSKMSNMTETLYDPNGQGGAGGGGGGSSSGGAGGVGCSGSSTGGSGGSAS
ncbi:MAG: DUF11 domain-containing protein, partial [Polyangiaceae bacterium]|nr:DUF11 domain-containing protein [Polyangiaceae bacterium]